MPKGMKPEGGRKADSGGDPSPIPEPNPVVGRLQRWLLRRLLGEDDARVLLSELSEQYDQRLETEGAAFARKSFRWDTRRALGLAFLARMHAEPPSSPPRGALPDSRGSGSALMDGLWEDVRFAVRTLRRAPAFALGVSVTLSLGIGANATVFRILDRLLLSPPEHVVEADRVYRLSSTQTNPSDGAVRSQLFLPYPDFENLKEVSAFSGVAATRPTDEVTLGSGVEAQRVRGRTVSWELFPLLGVTPHMGRFFSATEDKVGAPMTVVLGHGFWQRRFGGNPSVLGTTLHIQGVPAFVIGVAPAGFTGVTLDPVDVWLPLHPFTALHWDPADFLTTRRSAWIWVVARLGPDVALQRAQEEATSVFLRPRQGESPRQRSQWDTQIRLSSLIAARAPSGPASQPWDAASGQREAKVARWLAGVSLLVLLIACANVANLLLARILDRSREVAVRLALGVSRFRLATQMAMEALILSAFGGLLALALAQGLGRVICRLVLPDIEWSGASGTDRVLIFTVLVTVGAGLLAGILPAIQASRLSIRAALGKKSRGSSSGGTRVWQGLAIFQTMLACLLLVGAGLFLSSLSRIHRTDPGIDTEQVAQLQLEFEDGTREDLGGPEVTRRHEQVAQHLARLPGIAGVSLTTTQFQSLWSNRSLSVPELDSIPSLPGGGPYYQYVSPEHFSVVGLSILHGRAFAEDDQSGDPRVMVVSETMAETLWPGQSAVGKCVRLDQDSPSCFTVVGVARDATVGSIRAVDFMQFYLPLPHVPESVEYPRAAYVRLWADPGESLDRIRRESFRAVPGIRFVEIRPLQEILDPQARSWDLGATLFSALGVLALLVAAVGLISMLEYNVARRTRELGIRNALGATRGSVMGLVLSDGIRIAVLGLISGIIPVLLFGPRIEPLLFNVSARDPIVCAAVALLLLLVSAAASVYPAMRASRLDPMAALRAE